MVAPSSVRTPDRFIVKPIRKWIARCVEHGIWTALWSAAEHFENLDRYRRQLPAYDEKSVGDPHFEFVVLALGLTIATIVFGLECFLKEKKHE